MNATFRTSSRWALATGLLVVTLNVGAAYGAVNPEPGGSGSVDPTSQSADLARPGYDVADIATGGSSDYYLDQLVEAAHADAVHGQLAGLRR